MSSNINDININFSNELFIDNLIDTNELIPNYIQYNNIDLQTRIDYYRRNRTIFFLGTDFNWLIDKSIDLKNMYNLHSFFNQPIYFHSSCIRHNHKIYVTRDNDLNEEYTTYNRSKHMIDYFFDMIFLYNSEYFIIYLSDNSDIHIMTFAYYLLSKYKSCVFILENVNKVVFQYTYQETSRLRKLIYLKAKKNKCPIFFSKEEFLSSFINPLTHQFNIDLFSKLNIDNDSVLEQTTQSLTIKYEKLNENNSNSNMNVFNFNNNIHFLTYSNPIDISNSTTNTQYHRYSILTSKMKNGLSMDNVFHLLSNWTIITPYMYVYILPKIKDIHSNINHNINSQIRNVLTRNQYRIYKKYHYLYKMIPDIKFLDTDFYFNYQYILPFTKYLLNNNPNQKPSNRIYNARNFHFFKKYLNTRHPLQKKMIKLIEQLNYINKDTKKSEIFIHKLIQQIYVCYLFQELNESRYFLKNILSVEKKLQIKYYSLNNDTSFSLSNEFIAILKHYRHNICELDKVERDGSVVYQLHFYNKIPYFDIKYQSNIPLTYSDKYYSFKSSDPKDWIYEIINYYYNNL